MGLLYWLVAGLYCNAVLAEVVYYDSYSSAVITPEQKTTRDAAGNTYWCVNAFETCSETEGRRFDGSCNNLKHPYAGAGHSTFDRLLPGYHSFFDGVGSYFKADDDSLPSARAVRTTMLPDGSATGPDFTQLGLLFFGFVTLDFTPMTALDIALNLRTLPNCCSDSQSENPMCTPIEVPKDDALNQLSGITCLNFTRSIDYQFAGCIGKDIAPRERVGTQGANDLRAADFYLKLKCSTIESSNILDAFHLSRRYLQELWTEQHTVQGRASRGRADDALCVQQIQYGAPHLDMKPVYGVDPQTSLVHQRLLKGGLFNFSTTADGLQYPQLIPASVDDGMANNRGHSYLFSIMLWREHNRIATELSKLNPSWSDEKLFETARDINIAQYNQIVYYEGFANIFGKQNLVSDGVLLPDSKVGFRDVYDENVLPGWWTESLYAFRWFHSVLKSSMERYTLDGKFLDEVKVSLIVPAAALLSGNNITFLSQGLFRSNGARYDDKFDNFLGETGFGAAPTQKAFDLGSADIERGRSLGIAPYVEILHFCDGHDYEDFDSLKEYLDEDVIATLKDLYQTNEVVDIEMMPAVWREKKQPGSKVPKTGYCLMVKQLERMIKSDRHWYERENRPNAFTAAQLAEVRKVSFSRLMCDHIEGIKKTGIIARSFEPLSDKNPIVNCDTIPKIDLNAWKEIPSKKNKTLRRE